MTRSRIATALRWLERTLLVIGVVLAAWCLVLIVRAEYYARLPLPEPAPVRQLPGEEAGERGVRHAAPLGSWLGRLEAPSVDLTATVLEGSDDATLSRAAGHIEDTAYPGDDGNVGIAGHRDTVFRPVRRLRVGDAMTLTTAERVLHYRVSETKIVNPDDVYVLDPTGHPSLTLVTCYPFEFIGHAPRRFIVRAELLNEEARLHDAEAPAPLPVRLAWVPDEHVQNEPALVPKRTADDAPHKTLVRRQSHHGRVRADRARRVATLPDEPSDRKGSHGIGRAFQRVVSVGARGARRVWSGITPDRRPERD
jgi:sortase A